MRVPSRRGVKGGPDGRAPAYQALIWFSPWCCACARARRPGRFSGTARRRWFSSSCSFRLWAFSPRGLVFVGLWPWGSSFEEGGTPSASCGRIACNPSIIPHRANRACAILRASGTGRAQGGGAQWSGADAKLIPAPRACPHTPPPRPAGGGAVRRRPGFERGEGGASSVRVAPGAKERAGTRRPRSHGPVRRGGRRLRSYGWPSTSIHLAKRLRREEGGVKTKRRRRTRAWTRGARSTPSTPFGPAHVRRG